MLVPIDHLLNNPILSLQTGAELAQTKDVIIDPRQLKVVAFRVSGNRLDDINSVLHPEDIREISDIGLIIDNSDRLMSMDGLVRLQEIVDFNFNIIGINVIDDHKKKLGTVKGYSVDPNSMLIQQIYTKPTLIQSLSLASLTIHRSQIISVTNNTIVVKAPTVEKKVEDSAEEAPQPAFVNPFRSPAPTHQE